jgi:hypothetical protein
MWKKTKVMRISRQPSPVQIMIDQKQLQYVEYLNYLGSLITSDARRTHEIRSRIGMAKTAFNNKTFYKQTGLQFKKKLVKCYTWSIALHGAQKTLTLQKVHQKYLGSFNMWWWRKMEISWTDCVRNEEE